MLTALEVYNRLKTAIYQTGLFPLDILPDFVYANQRLLICFKIPDVAPEFTPVQNQDDEDTSHAVRKNLWQILLWLLCFPLLVSISTCLAIFATTLMLRSPWILAGFLAVVGSFHVSWVFATYAAAAIGLQLTWSVFFIWCVLTIGAIYMS